MSPYWGANFFSFFKILITRLFTGEMSPLATDEIQMGVLIALAICCGAIGPFIVLKKMAMFANSLSHTILLGITGAFLIFGGQILFDLPHLLIAALIAAIFTALLTEALMKIFKLTEDASVGLGFTSLFALGLVLVTLFTRDVHLGVEAVMGNADALMISDLHLTLFLAALNLLALLLFYRHFQLASFDSGIAKTLGLHSSSFHFLLLFLTATTCIGAFRAVGVLLVLAFLVGPYLTARLFCHRLKALIGWSIALGALASLFGVALSRHILSEYNLPLSTGGIVVSSIGLFYLLAVVVRKIASHKWMNLLLWSRH
jgi:manganese/zinc/iron transport system permease protein